MRDGAGERSGEEETRVERRRGQVQEKESNRREEEVNKSEYGCV